MATMAPDSQLPSTRRFWCHECARNVETREGTDGELCCVACNSNFVEEVEADDPPEEFLVPNTEAGPPAASSNSASAASETPRDPDSDARPRSISEGGQPAHVVPRTPPSAAAARRSHFAVDGHDERARARREVPSPLTELLQQLVGGSGDVADAASGGPTTRTARIIRSNGTPVEVYVTSAGEGRGAGDIGGDGLFGLLGGIMGGPFGGFASNPGDYALGPNHLSQLINQLMQNDSNRHGAPPAAKEVVDTLPKHKVVQHEVDANAECAVCKDLFAVDDEAQDLPCAHSFHPDCIMPWLKMHNSCPVCRYELPTDDEDYEARRRREARNANAASRQAS